MPNLSLRQQIPELENYEESLRLKLEEVHKELSDYKYALDQASIVAVTDIDGIITNVNDKFCEISQFSREELIGKSHKIINSGFHTADFFKEFWQTIRAGKVWKGEIKNKAKDGSFYWVLTIIVPFVNCLGETFQFMALRTDITARKIAEEKLKFEHELHEQMLIERTKLESSERAALEASRLKSQFLANMSHEIRTPLNGILGMAKLLQKSNLNDFQKEYLGTILDSAEHLSLIVNDILDLAKIESDKMQLELTEFNLEEMVTGIEKALKHLALIKNIDFKVITDFKTSSFFLSDFLKIRQILLNLVQNAIKFTESGEVRLKVETYFIDSKSYARFEVSDSGIGMSEQTLNAIFNPFVQADSSTTRKYGGTGLGLSISKKLVELMQGQLEVESELNKGTVFKFSIPLKVTEKIKISISEVSSKISIEDRKKINILVAEDHTINQKVIKRILENYGCQFKIVSDGLEALEEIKSKSKYDLVLMDCHMPNCDGFTASKMIREQNFKMPIIALTADAMKGTKEKCLNSGMNTHLSKPINPQVLFLEIEKLITQNYFFDTSYIEKLNQLKKSPDDLFVKEIIEDFLKSAPEKIKTIADSFDAKDIKKIFHMAHNLKSVSASLGLIELARLCLDLEKLAQILDNDPDQNIIQILKIKDLDLVAKINLSFINAQVYLNEYLKKV